MKIFISWSGVVSKEIAGDLREWLPLINQSFIPYMSSEDIEKGSHWSASIRRELEASSFGLLILTPENTESPWLHFEAGAIAKSFSEAKVAPILFHLKPSDIKQPLALFQATLFDKEEILRLLKTMNAAAGESARDDKQLEKVFARFWPDLERTIDPRLKALRATPRGAEREKNEIDRILQEILVSVRQQTRILSDPNELFGRQVLGLLLSLVHEPEGAAIRLAGREKELTLALCARWSQLSRDLRQASVNEARVSASIRRFSEYVSELQSILVGTATPDSIAKAFGRTDLSKV